MSVYRSSRYRTGKIFRVRATRNGETQKLPVIYTRDSLVANAEVALIHTVQAGERIDQLAYKYAKDSSLWWVIAEVNNLIRFPLFMRPGLQLKIPTLAAFRSIAVATTFRR